ncbi:MAG: hypothetical protein IPN60_06410 [Saprospiraceae bacterium]|nr:hypothetical protein [Candidatus Opimibacter skivensis]
MESPRIRAVATVPFTSGPLEASAQEVALSLDDLTVKGPKAQHRSDLKSGKCRLRDLI